MIELSTADYLADSMVMLASGFLLGLLYGMYLERKNSENGT